MDGAPEELVQKHLVELFQKLKVLMEQGISIQKENAVTAFATTVVVVKEKFDPHFEEVVQLMLKCLNDNPQPEYRQFRA